MKSRLDVLLMRRTGYSRAFVKELIERTVLVDGREVNKPGTKCAPDADIRFAAPTEVYVSRGGYKLAHALRQFSIDLRGRTCLDAGASTGGFTDCMLQNGAAKVYAVDVGTGQLDARLRGDARVVAMENTDLRALVPEALDAIGFLTADLSFISLTKVLPQIARLLAGEKAEGVLLVKPQFEAGRAHLSKRGVVKDRRVHARVLDEVRRACADCGLVALAHTESPVIGHAGNVEYLLHVKGAGVQ